MGSYDDMESVITDLRQIPRDVRNELTPVLKQAGEGAAQDARARAGWSSRIPGAIRVQVRYGQRRPGVLLRVVAKRAPHARPYENLGKAGVFRHPGWGDREHWYAQAARPFAWPAIVGRKEEIGRNVAGVVETAARQRGFH